MAFTKFAFEVPLLWKWYEWVLQWDHIHGIRTYSAFSQLKFNLNENKKNVPKCEDKEVRKEPLGNKIFFYLFFFSRFSGPDFWSRKLKKGRQAPGRFVLFPSCPDKLLSPIRSYLRIPQSPKEKSCGNV